MDADIEMINGKKIPVGGFASFGDVCTQAGPARTPFASRSARRALLMPQPNPGSLNGCGKSMLRAVFWATTGGEGPETPPPKQNDVFSQGGKHFSSAPIRIKGMAVGTLCVLDRKERNDVDMQKLQQIADRPVHTIDERLGLRGAPRS